MEVITFDDFMKVEIRSGTVVKTELFPKARKPAYKVWVDFGDELGVKQTSAQITAHYAVEELIGRQVMGCVNLGTKNIAGFVSEFLLLGFADDEGEILLAQTQAGTPNGQRLH